MNHPYPLRPDTVLENKYRIVRVLGSGGFGMTYLAEHLHLENKRYAGQSPSTVGSN